MAIADVTAWATTIENNPAHHPTGPRGRNAGRISRSFQEMQAAIAEFRDAPAFGGPVTFPSYTSAQLNDITDAVNTSAAKVAGSTVYNSTVGHLVTAQGSADGDVWVDGVGTTVNTPV